MDSPRETVFNTPELFANVLLHLDMKTLLTASQRVSRAWHDFIAESPSLQQHLFLQPAPASYPHTRNPLLAELFPPWFPPEGSNDAEFEGTDLDRLPLAQDNRNGAFKYENASWRRMYFRQPPVQSLLHCVFINGQAGDAISLRAITQNSRRGEPLWMDTLYDLVTGGSGTSPKWQFIWDRPGTHSDIPDKIWFTPIPCRIKETMKQALLTDGILMLEKKVPQCVPGAMPYALGRKVVVATREFDYEEWGSHSISRMERLRMMFETLESEA